jgi:hypothetical protein
MFESDIAFLKQHTDAFSLEAPDSLARVAVVPQFQARVMTSSAAGDRGDSFGWINRDLIASGRRQPHINPFGGEDRIWFGPEGGQFSVFFPPGAPFDLEHWQTPPPMDWGPWDLASRTRVEARFQKSFSLTNYSGTVFTVKAERAIRVLGRQELARAFGMEPSSAYDVVAFESENRLINAGQAPWRPETGLLSIWVLGMFRPSPRTTVILPFEPGPESERGPVVNDAYFGKPPADRLAVDPAGVVFFKADGAHRSKIGLSPRRARPIMGSYDAERSVLTLVTFTLPAGVADYVNSMWEIQEHPLAGDVSNSYNDGPPAPGQKPLGPFYELETSSPAAALGPGQGLVHVHRTLHAQGARTALEPLARGLLGVSLEGRLSV